MDLFQTCNTVVFWNQGIPKKVLTVWDSFGGRTKSYHVKWKLGILSLSCSQSDHLSTSQADDTDFEAGTFSWQDPVHSWKAGPGECMTVENKQTNPPCQ